MTSRSNRECARRIEEYYHEKGFAFATVELEKGECRDDREIVIVINEGQKVSVTDIKIDNYQIAVNEALATKTRTKTQVLLLSGGKYDPRSAENAIEVVKQYYFDQGYFTT